MYIMVLINHCIHRLHHLQTLNNHVIYDKGNQYVTRFHANEKGGGDSPPFSVQVTNYLQIVDNI